MQHGEIFFHRFIPRDWLLQASSISVQVRKNVLHMLPDRTTGISGCPITVPYRKMYRPSQIACCMTRDCYCLSEMGSRHAFANPFEDTRRNYPKSSPGRRAKLASSLSPHVNVRQRDKIYDHVADPPVLPLALIFSGSPESPVIIFFELILPSRVRLSHVTCSIIK